MGKLTDEQIDKAIAAYRDAYNSEFTSINARRAGLIAAAPHLQYAPEPPQIAGDVIERMLKAYADVRQEAHLLTEWGTMSGPTAMTAAAKVQQDWILEIVREVFLRSKSCPQWGWDDFREAVRARIERPKSAEERVTVEATCKNWSSVLVDGVVKATVHNDHVNAVRSSFIETLKAEGR